MNVSTIKLAAIGSLLCVAFSQSVEARSIRADNGPNAGDWVASSPYSIDGLSFAPGITSVGSQTYVATGNVTDAFNEPDGSGLNIVGSQSTMYNYYTSSSPLAISSTPQDQIVVYKLDVNSTSIPGLAANASLVGDVEVDFNYTSSVPGASYTTASFTFGESTYSSMSGSTPNANFLFSANGALLGSLAEGASTANSGFNSSLPAEWSVTNGSGAAAAPEIDSSSTITALTILVGMLAVGMRRSKASARVLNV